MKNKSDKKDTMTDEQILKIDFYDICGCWAIFMSEDEKIKYYRDNAKYYGGRTK